MYSTSNTLVFVKGLKYILCQKRWSEIVYILFEATCGFAKMCSNTLCQVIFSMYVVVTFDQFFIGMSLQSFNGREMH